jgi:tRNA-2-methylthio-N6-dimethylallyladenosine synthase
VYKRQVLAPLGYELADDYVGADMVILNTCHIREKASEKVFSELGRIRAEKNKKPEMLISVAGCVAQAEGAEIIRRAPYVDMVVGPQGYHQLPEMIAKAERKAGRSIMLDFTPDEKFDRLAETARPQGVSAFLTIQEGCDKFCTFCVVPYTRGAEYNRDTQSILDEAKRLVDQGAVDINLLGQNVNSHPDLPLIIEKLADMPEIQRIKYTTSHPNDMTDALIEAHKIPKLMPWLHLPVQSGSNKVLKEMNRKHERGFYLELIAKLEAARPDLVFSSDFIVGFPGESEADFEDTMDIVRRVNYTQCYSFKYSPRPGTPGSLRTDQVPDAVASERLNRLQALIVEKQLAFNRSFIGKNVEVLIDRTGKFDGQVLGKTPFMQSVYLSTKLDNFGNLVNVKINNAFQNSLSGEIVETLAKAA